MILFENRSVKICLDSEVPCLDWIATNHVSSDEFRESELESVKQYEILKQKYPMLEWFVDARKVEGLHTEDTEWAAEVILPKMADLGLTKEAFVLPSNVFGQFTIEDYKNEVADGRVTIHMFDDVTEAKKWLQKKN